MPYGYWTAELPGGSEEWTNRGFKATVQRLANWDERNALACSILANGGEYYPRIPQTMARARSCQVAPFEAAIAAEPFTSSQFADYQYAVLTIAYDSEGPNGDELISESVEPTAEFMPLDYTQFRWDSETGDPMKEGEAPGKLVHGLEYKITFARALYLPSAILDYGGCVNDEVIPSYTLGLTFEPDTLLFKPPVSSRKITTEAVEAWQLSYRFLHRPAGWNKYWRAKSQSWSEPWIKNASGIWERYYNYPQVDFAALFPV